jgi:hypothetical protein
MVMHNSLVERDAVIPPILSKLDWTPLLTIVVGEILTAKNTTLTSEH